jgi:hypothetical protein
VARRGRLLTSSCSRAARTRLWSAAGKARVGPAPSDAVRGAADGPTLDVAGRGPAEQRLDAAELGGAAGARSGPTRRRRRRSRAGPRPGARATPRRSGRQQQAGRSRLGQEAPERPLERLAMHDRPRQRDLLPAQIEHQGPGRIHAGQHGVQVLDAGAAQAALAREASDDLGERARARRGNRARHSQRRSLQVSPVWSTIRSSGRADREVEGSSLPEAPLNHACP